MNIHKGLLVGLWLASVVTSPCADLIKAKDGSGRIGYKDTPKLPWCGYLVHDPDRPAPPKIDPGPAPAPAPVPADAIVLFGGKDLVAWKEADWTVEDGEIVTGTGVLASRQDFGDAQIHLEWMSPANFDGPWHNQGNNGVSLMGLFEIQIFDSLNVDIYADGQCAAIYGQTPPRVNVCREPGQWQSYDIVLKAPVYEGEKLVEPAFVTVLHNGVLVHLNEPIHGPTGHRILAQYKNKVTRGPLALSGHHCPVRFRNIWVREL